MSLGWWGTLGFMRGWVQALLWVRSLVCWVPAYVIGSLCLTCMLTISVADCSQEVSLAGLWLCSLRLVAHPLWASVSIFIKPDKAIVLAGMSEGLVHSEPL